VLDKFIFGVFLEKNMGENWAKMSIKNPGFFGRVNFEDLLLLRSKIFIGELRRNFFSFFKGKKESR